MSAPAKNQNAVKGEAAASSWLQVRVVTRDKSAWVKAAQRRGKNLSEWVIEILNAAAK